MNQPPTDILRELHGAADRAGLACTKTGNFRVAMIDAAHLRAAAAEIERLQNERNAFEAERDELVRISNKLKHERDEARQSVCKMCVQLGGVFRRVGGKVVEVTTAEGCAEIMRWDCFKEDTND